MREALLSRPAWRHALLLGCAWFSIGGCAGSGSSDGAGGSSAGGVAARGGAAHTGGAPSLGGAPGLGGGAEQGGAVANGGSASAGRAASFGGSSAGRDSAGGALASAGAANAGALSRGGTSPSGGTAGASGGAPAGGNATSGATIQNDVFWKDSSGTPIYSQGGGVLKVGDVYYWYGVKYNGAVTYAAKPSASNEDTSFAGVTIYSSRDLASWKLENTVKFSNAGDWFGRLGVVYNANTKKYVLVAQGAGGLFFATSDTPTGDFKFDNVQTTLSGIANGSTGDQTTFQDDDGKAYLICSSSSGRSNLYVVPLREADFLAIGTPKRIFGGVGREGNALFKFDGRYYFCSSDLHGWNASHTYCISATNILGPYGEEFVLANTDADFSHVSQTGFFITVQGSAGSFVIFAGDRWSDFAGNGLGYNQWVPLSFERETPTFHSLSQWTLDVARGTWSVGPDNNFALNPSFEADRVEVTTPAGWTVQSGKNVRGGYSGRWSWQLSGASSLEQQVSALPNGTYRLSAWVKGSAVSGATLYANGFGDEHSVALSSLNNSWAKVSLEAIQVSGGQGKIGVSASAGTLIVDDFSLTRQP